MCSRELSKNEMDDICTLEMCSVSKEFAEIFAEESENDKTFYGFSDSETSPLHCDKSSDSGDALEPEQQPSKQPAARRFQLRVALRSRPPAHSSSEAEEEEEERKEEDVKSEVEVKSEVDEKPLTAAALKSPKSPKSGSESDTDVSKTFLAQRAQNIKANKAMLAQLMADLQKMPGGGGLLKKQGAKRQKAEKGSRTPRSGANSRRNPERASRRQTRSMGGCEDSPAPEEEEEELEMDLEKELLQVRGAPRPRGNPRPNQGKPHVVRPVQDITEDELQLVADTMTEKVYNSVSGSTCHQCRQKTTDTKTCCRSEDCRGIQGQFCGPCLRNRYGEDVKKALLDPVWQCPPCRGICNCSFCRARDGRCPTGILFPLAQYHGFSDVHSYLCSLRNKLKEAEEDL